VINSVEEFIALRTSDDPSDQHRASHDSAPLEVWFDIVQRSPDMRSWVANNKTVPVAVLEVLAKDPDAEVRMAVAMKRKCPPQLLEALSTDAEPAVRLRVAYNAKTPRAVLQKMLQDGWERVVEVAASRLRSEGTSS
jgi:hypothetical protein